MAYYEFTIKISDTFKDTLVQRLSESGCLGMIENDESLVAYFPSALDVETIKCDLSLLKTLLEKAGHAHELTYDYYHHSRKGLERNMEKRVPTR